MTRAARWTFTRRASFARRRSAELRQRERRGPSVVTRTIHVKLSTTGQEVMFDQQRLDLPFAKTIRLKYKNDAPLDSQISHNVAIIRPERVAAVMAIAAGPRLRSRRRCAARPTFWR